MRQETVTLDGPVDFELGRPRTHPLTYTISWPDSRPARGLAILIGGCGGEGETSEGRSRNTREHIVEQCGLAAVTVDYHCIQSRPSNGGAMHFDGRERWMLLGMAVDAGIPLQDIESPEALIEALGLAGGDMSGLATIKPGRGESQNFGILQAMDHLVVLGHLLEHSPGFAPRKVYALGGSHGGYIAQLMAKMAPGVLAGVFDNSGYVQPPMNYLGMTGMAEHTETVAGFDVHCRVESAWSFDRRDANFYDRNRDLIRDTGFIPHMNVMKAATPRPSTAFSAVVCADDHVVPPKDKTRQLDLLGSRGFPTKLQIVQADEIDGVIFKEFTHAMRVSFKRLCARELAWMMSIGASGAADWPGSVDYDCIDVTYRFERLARAPYMLGSVLPRDLDAAVSPL
jgi:hypothetical protein